MMPLSENPLPEEYAQFWRLWAQEEYFECHEVLEEAWRREQDGERKRFFQGLIHCAVALVHHERQNKTGAFRQLEKARTKLAGLAPEYSGCDTRAVLEFVERRLADEPQSSAGLEKFL